MRNQCLTRSEFNQVMAVMIAALDREFPETQVDAYFALLNDIPVEILKVAVLRALSEAETTFLPAVGLLRRFAAEAAHGVIPTWGVEWERVMTAIRRFGRDRGKEASEFLGEFTTRIVRQLGWREICDSQAIGVQMSLFRSLYESAAEVESSNRRLSIELRPAVCGPASSAVDSRRLISSN